MVFYQAGTFHPEVQLAEQMAQTLICVAPSDIEYPLAKDGLIDKCRPPHSSHYAAIFTCKLIDLVLSDASHGAPGQSDHPVVHLSKESHVKVTEVSWNDKVHDLPRAIPKSFVTGRPAAEHHMNVFGAVALPGDVVFAGDIARVLAKLVYSCPVMSIQVS